MTLRRDRLERLRRLELVAIGTRLARAGLILPGEGNLSVRLGADLCLVTPAGRDKGRLRAVDILRVPLAQGEAMPPGSSSEVTLHVTVYRQRTDVEAVVHAHPSRVLAAAASDKMPDWRALLETEMILGEVTSVDSLAPGSAALATGVAAGLHNANACVLRRHGAVTVGRDLGEAALRMELLERLAEIAISTP